MSILRAIFRRTEVKLLELPIGDENFSPPVDFRNFAGGLVYGRDVPAPFYVGWYCCPNGDFDSGYILAQEDGATEASYLEQGKVIRIPPRLFGVDFFRIGLFEDAAATTPVTFGAPSSFLVSMKS